MTNYNQTNIYRKQMQELGLNAKQYAELTGMPYEVVKDILYNKEGDYSMEIKDLLRNTMFNKHQEIENDFDNTKFKAMELKNDVNYLKWFDKEYTLDLLKEKLHLNSIIQFENNYCLKINNKRASHWTYQVLVSKREYQGHSIEKGKKLEFIKQLYDIIVNDNADAYYNPTTNKVINITPIKSNGKINYKKWYKNFDIKQWKKENNIDNYKLCNILKLSYFTISNLVTKKSYSQATLEKFYNYVMGIEAPQNNQKDNKTSDTFDVKQLDNEDIEVLSLPNEMTEAEKEILREQPQVITTYQEPEIEVITSNDDILRKILINRLTDEEKELIRLFGGKIC